MKHWMSLAVLVACFSTVAWAAPHANDVLEETLYQNFKQKLQSKENSKSLAMSALSRYEQSLFVDALWDLTEEGDLTALNSVNEVATFNYELTERLRVAILRIKYHRATALPDLIQEEVLAVLHAHEVDTKIVYTLAAYESLLLEAGHEDIIELAKLHPSYQDIANSEARRREITTDIVTDLFHFRPNVSTYMNGEYAHAVTIYKFCRENRIFPCLMAMKDIRGNVVRNDDGTLWTHQSLASSAKGLPSYARNGNTPAGIFTIDSVMPVADQQVSFGKFRRMMLNFVPKSRNEQLFKSLIPESSHESDWWRPSIAARDIGRNLFRIHGTGKINNDPTTPYFPFMRTSGCIAQRENTYTGVTYKDQRDLLDKIMVAMDMAPIYENELKIKGILYLIEIDDQNAPVTAEDLILRGIE